MADLIPVKNRSLNAAQYGALADVPLTLGDLHDSLLPAVAGLVKCQPCCVSS